VFIIIIIILCIIATGIRI